jgi:hypothetical protein
VGVALSVEV